MRWRYVSFLVLCGTAACASESGDVATDQGLLESPSALAGTKLTPSNLPADICDTPGAVDLNVPSGGADLDVSTCDAVVPQAQGFAPICVRKFANVAIDGSLYVEPTGPQNAVVAIVATGTFRVDGSVIALNGLDSADPRSNAPGCGGGGELVSGTGTQLAAGGLGGASCDYNGTGVGERARAGGAIQLVACGELSLGGGVHVSGSNGRKGDGADTLTPPAQSGGGGASAGTLLIEASRLTTFAGAYADAIGGNGGDGGDYFRLSTGTYPGGAGGLGETGSRPATLGQPPASVGLPVYPGGGGHGGRAGRILVNLPQGVRPPSLVADPPASFGIAATH